MARAVTNLPVPQRAWRKDRRARASRNASKVSDVLVTNWWHEAPNKNPRVPATRVVFFIPLTFSYSPLLSKYVEQANLQGSPSRRPPYPLPWRFCLCLDKEKDVDTKKTSTREVFFVHFDL